MREPFIVTKIGEEPWFLLLGIPFLDLEIAISNNESPDKASNSFIPFWESLKIRLRTAKSRSDNSILV
jgi:hypothetical protein